MFIGHPLDALAVAHDRGRELRASACAAPADEYPDLVNHVLQHLEPAERHEGGRELGAGLILNGLEGLRDSA